MFSSIFLRVFIFGVAHLSMNVDASPLMSVHSDSNGRRFRTHTSWAPSAYDDNGFEIFNPMVKSKTIKTERVRPFNFRPAVETTFPEPNGVQSSDLSRVFPLQKGAFDMTSIEEGPKHIGGLDSFVDELKARLRNEISMLLLTNPEDDLLLKMPDTSRILADDRKSKKFLENKSILNHPATFGKRRFMPTQLV